MAACSENFLCGNDFVAVLAIFHPCWYGANASETVEKIATDEKDYTNAPCEKRRNRNNYLLTTHPA